jgi:hypothetical protein
VYGGQQSGDLPTVIGPAALAVRFVEKQVPPGIQGVHLEFEIVAGVARGIEENFEIVVVEDHRIVLGEGGPNVRFLEFGGHVEIPVVPEHFDSRPIARRGVAGALYVDEVFGPVRVAPRGVVEVAIDADRRGGAVASVVLGRLRKRGGGEREKSEEARHQSGQMLAISTETWGKSLGVRVPVLRIWELRR